MTYINDYSWKCLLGKQSKNIEIKDSIYFWDVNKNHHFCTSKNLIESDLDGLENKGFHYMTPENLSLLKTKYKVNKSNLISVCIDLDKFKISGKSNSGIRHSINSAKKHNLTIKESFNDINDVKKMLNEWSEVLAEKYFRDFSGKNHYFYQNNFHKDCVNLFLYDKDDLVAFASASPEKDNCSYIIGKALCNRIHGLSEYADYLLYNKLIESGVSVINLGQAKGGLYKYKRKFSGSFDIVHHDGFVEGIK